MERNSRHGEARRVPEPPWRLLRRTGGRREPLSRDAIVEASLVLLDREGVEALSMRRVAEELGTGAASLYWHVRSKDELFDLLLDRISAEAELPSPDAERWQEQVRELAREARRILKRHRDAARLTMGRFPIGPNLLRVSEWLLAVLRAGGLPDQTAAWASHIIWLYISSFTLDEISGLAPAHEGDAHPGDVLESYRAYFLSLPQDLFPNLVALAHEVTRGDLDGRFEFGLDLIIGGLSRQTEG